MKRALLIAGSHLFVLGVVPSWGTEDYFGIKRVQSFEIGVDLYRLRVVESGHAGRNDWNELGRMSEFEPLGVSAALLALGAGLMIGSRLVRSVSRTSDAAY